ncbi:ACP S-malonyltransferase [Lachnospiraceae bacterium LCP25S3_G4]
MNKIAFIFPGQGAQKAGMGKDFYEQYEIAREVYDTASRLLNIDIKALCFEENKLLDITEYTQVALVTTCLAMLRVLEDQGVKADVTAGLSLGEYPAIVAAGGMDFEDAIQTVRKRGILMQEAVPIGQGAMAAVLGMTGEAIEEALKNKEGVSIANYNCPGQIVITGNKDKVINASEELLALGAKRTIMLNVSGPFHSPMLKDAKMKLAKVLKSLELRKLKIPYVTNVTAEYTTDIVDTKELLAIQVVSSVRWQQSIENMIAHGVDTFIEVGPGKTLAGFLKKINRAVTVYNIETVEDVKTVVEKLSL